MSTVQTVNGVKYFEFKGDMITKGVNGWVTLEGKKFNGTKVANYVRGKAVANRANIMHIRSILNRYFSYELNYII